MTTIKSNEVLVGRTPGEVTSFFSDLNNLESVMPDQVCDWKSDFNSCSFTIKGMGTVSMSLFETFPGEKVVLKKAGKAPFDFNLICQTGSSGDAGSTTVFLMFEAELNPVMKMMAEKPLQNFLNLIIDRYRLKVS
jgi:carbon monoxide dehydrogenase subunit G